MLSSSASASAASSAASSASSATSLSSGVVVVVDDDSEESPEEWHETRQACLLALEDTVHKGGGKKYQQHKQQSNSRRVVMRCTSGFVRGVYQADQLAGFSCNQLPFESDALYRKRKAAAAKVYARSKNNCMFEAIAMKGSARSERPGMWMLQTYAVDGKLGRYIPHSAGCKACDLKCSKAYAMLQLEKVIAANPNMGGKAAAELLVGENTSITAATIGSKSTLYAAMQSLKDRDLQYYDYQWGQVELYLRELKQKNPDMHVALEKSQDNRFERYVLWYCVQFLMN